MDNFTNIQDGTILPWTELCNLMLQVQTEQQKNSDVFELEAKDLHLVGQVWSLFVLISTCLTCRVIFRCQFACVLKSVHLSSVH
jgi:hypothetical protein